MSKDARGIKTQAERMLRSARVVDENITEMVEKELSKFHRRKK